MKNNGVCAVVVLFNGDCDVLEKNLIALLSQTEKIILVDNGSNKDLSCITAFCKKWDIEVVQNGKNLGIATALNIGAAKAAEYKYLLTMDQDSILAENAVDKMLAVMDAHKDIVSVGPNYNGISYKNEVEYKQVLISSGNLTLMDWYKRVGGFEDALFIDKVDFDFSLALQKIGGKCAIARDAHMSHHLGEKETGKCLFITKNIITHSPQRYFYMYRNDKIIVRKYWRDFPAFCLKLCIMAKLHELELILFHPNKKAKISAIRKGKKAAKGRFI